MNKNLRPRLFALSQSRLSTVIKFPDLLREIFLCLSLNLSWSALCFFFRQIQRDFDVTIFLSWGFLKCSFLKTGRARNSLMRFTFLDDASWEFLLSRLTVSYQMRPENFMVCPAEAFNPILLLSVEKNSLDLSFDIHNTCFFRPCAEVTSSPSACRNSQRIPQMHLFPDL